MCIRLYPDFIVAMSINEDIQRRFKYLNKEINDLITKEDVITVISKIVISPAGCVERQHNLLNEGLCNVFIGYNYNNNWEITDYEEYLRSLPSFFIEDDFPGFFKMNPNIIKLYCAGDTVKTFSEYITELLLTKARYSENIKRKYGLII